MNNPIAVVVPTYNEKDNILKLIAEIENLNLSADIIVVDDNSPDGTGRIVESLKNTKSNIEVVHRKRKEGIGPAYIEGFRHALMRPAYKFIIQMDADFSHNPKDILRLLDAAAGGVAVGSRYVKGGAVSDRWNIARKLISRLGNLYARIITGLEVNDCTSGFKCYKREALGSLDLDRIFLNGYGFQIQILYELKRNKFRIREIPIFFDERARGLSKMSLDIVGEAFFSLLFMRARDMFAGQ